MSNFSSLFMNTFRIIRELLIIIEIDINNDVCMYICMFVCMYIVCNIGGLNVRSSSSGGGGSSSSSSSSCCGNGNPIL